MRVEPRSTPSPPLLRIDLLLPSQAALLPAAASVLTLGGFYTIPAAVQADRQALFAVASQGALSHPVGPACDEFYIAPS